MKIGVYAARVHYVQHIMPVVLSELMFGVEFATSPGGITWIDLDADEEYLACMVAAGWIDA